MSKFVKHDSGVAVRFEGGGYFDMNGIGDWSLAGDPTTASLFTTLKEAKEFIRELHIEDHAEYVSIVRTVEVKTGADAELQVESR